jgi:predicted RNase H-like HicB family nuclease
MNYPVVIHKDKDSDYGVTVPDLPGCFTAGSTVDEALAMAKEAVEVYLEYLIDEGKPIPAPGSIEEHKDNPDYKGGTWALVAIDQSSLHVKAKRINITMPERVLDAVDRYARQVGETRSGVLVQAVTQYISRAGQPAFPGKGRGRKPKDKVPTKES